MNETFIWIVYATGLQHIQEKNWLNQTNYLWSCVLIASIFVLQLSLGSGFVGKHLSWKLAGC